LIRETKKPPGKSGRFLFSLKTEWALPAITTRAQSLADVRFGANGFAKGRLDARRRLALAWSATV
jgi:hypothetical protein